MDLIILKAHGQVYGMDMLGQFTGGNVIDAGFGNAEATYLLAKKMIEAGACALQIENQVSDEKQCGHQDGKVTVPHEDFIAKIRAIRYASLELGV